MDKDFIYLIRNAINLSNDKVMNCHDVAEDSGRFFWIYPFTTENISGYIDLFDLKYKSLLTVGSSGDQAINAILKDCKDITVLDVNPFTKYYFDLKKAALLTLNYEEFCRFFCYIDYPKVFKYNDDAFNYDSYKKLKSLLNEIDDESYLFWDTLFDVCKEHIVRKKLFANDEERVSVIKGMNIYLKDESNFNETKIKIKSISPKFIKGDIFKLKLEKTYDNIWLSNIGCYYSLEDTRKLVEKLDNNLNINGKMLMCYLYQTKSDTKYMEGWDPIYNLDETFKVLGNFITFFETFLGVQGLKFEEEKMKDSTLIYQKKK
ncbi:MAG: DUF3419 family protein [Bacilli bacterium]|nr:DUF3419 family protein [Bacilli bacterium]